MTKYLPFYLDEKEYFTNQKCFIISGEKLGYLTAFFNSKLFKYCFRDSFPELQGGTRELSKIFFEKIPVMKVDDSLNQVFTKLVNKIQHLKMEDKDTSIEENTINEMIFNLYQVNQEEASFINSWIVDKGLS